MTEGADFVEALTCPETGQTLEPLDEAELMALNDAIRDGELVDDAGKRVERTIDRALVRTDGKVAYPVRDGIPNLLLGDRIRLDHL